jgi:mRNA interferase YafQ
MRTLRLSGAFKRDMRRLEKRGYDCAKLDLVVDRLRSGNQLPPSCRPHPLKGQWRSYHECHIAPDWLLIYRPTPDELLLARTGTHADLFGE